MKIKRTVTETLDIPDDLSIEEAAQLLQNPPPETIDDERDGDLEEGDEADTEDAGETDDGEGDEDDDAWGQHSLRAHATRFGSSLVCVLSFAAVGAWTVRFS